MSHGPDVYVGDNIPMQPVNDYAEYMPGASGATHWNFGVGNGDDVYPEWNPESPAYTVYRSPDSYLPTVNEYDPAIGGSSGQLNKSLYTIGVVNANNVENFEMTGRTIRVRRQPDTNYGPVSGGPDHSANYLPQYAQAVPMNIPDEHMYADIGGHI